jgi:translation initiation factor IF-2
VPRAGAGWMLTRAPDDWRGRADEPGVERRDRRPPRGPRPDGVRPPMGARGDRPPRGPRPDRGGRPGFAGGRPEGGGGRPPAPGRPEGRDASAGAGHGSRRPPGPRPSEGSGPRGDERPWAGRRRGGWDEPAVPEAVAPAVPVAPAADEAPASVESMPVPAGDGSANVAADSTATPSTTGNS